MPELCKIISPTIMKMQGKMRHSCAKSTLQTITWPSWLNTRSTWASIHRLINQLKRQVKWYPISGQHSVIHITRSRVKQTFTLILMSFTLIQINHFNSVKVKEDKDKSQLSQWKVCRWDSSPLQLFSPLKSQWSFTQKGVLDQEWAQDKGARARTDRGPKLLQSCRLLTIEFPTSSSKTSTREASVTLKTWSLMETWMPSKSWHHMCREAHFSIMRTVMD